MTLPKNKVPHDMAMAYRVILDSPCGTEFPVVRERLLEMIERIGAAEGQLASEKNDREVIEDAKAQA